MSTPQKITPADIDRRLAKVDIIGLYTIYRKETLRFLRVYNQTLLAPAVTALLYLAVFNLAVGRHALTVGEVPFAVFMISGLIAMSAMQNAFANSSSSLVMGKVLGTLSDYLVPPLAPGHIVFAVTASGVTRGLMVALVTGAACYIFVPFGIAHPLFALFYLVLASAIMALAGILSGLFAESFDQMAAVTSYVVTPLAFLSGTFYPVDSLPPFWRGVTSYNPFFHMIDGFRYGMTGTLEAKGGPALGLILLFTTLCVLALACYSMLRSGYRVKS